VGQNRHLPSLENETKKQKCVENGKAAAKFRLIDVILLMTVYFLV